MKSYRKTNFRIQQRNQHLKNILEENYYIELGAIDVNILEDLLLGHVVSLDDIVYEEITNEGIGQVLDGSSNELKYQLTFLESLRYKSTSNKIFLTYGVLHYKLPNDTHYSYAPIVLIPVEIDYHENQIVVSSEPIVNTLLKNEIQASLGISVDPLTSNASLFDIHEYCINFANKTKFEHAVGNYLTVLSIEYLENKLNTLDLSTQRSIYEKSAFNVQQEYFGQIKAVQVTNINQKWALLKIANGESFVVDGKLGTGKTYTIVNAICDAILKNKKVLYVSHDFNNINHIYKELNSFQASSYVYSLSKNTLFDKIEEEELPVIREEKIGTETLYPIAEYEQALEASIHGCRYNKIITTLAELKNTIPDIVKMPIDVNLRNHEIEHVYNDLKEIEEILETIEPLDINVWSNIEQYYSKQHAKEIINATNNYATTIKLFNNKIKQYCKKYQIELPESFIGAQRLLSYISTFTKIAPPKCWVEKYDSKKINELLNTIASFQKENIDIKETLKTKVIDSYQTNDTAQILKSICHTHLTPENVQEITSIINETEKIQEIVNIIKQQQELMSKSLQSLKRLLDVENISHYELGYLKKLNNLLTSSKVSLSWPQFYMKNKMGIKDYLYQMKEIVSHYLELKDKLLTFAQKEEYLQYDYIKDVLSDRNYLKVIPTFFDKKLLKKHKTSLDIVNHEYINLFEVGQRIETECKKNNIMGKFNVDVFSVNFLNWINFILNLTDDETRIFRQQLNHDYKIFDDRGEFLKVYSEYSNSEKLLNEQYDYIKKYGITIEGNTIIDRNYNSLDWLIYLRKIIHVNHKLQTLYKNTIPSFEDMMLVIYTDKEYVSLVKKLDYHSKEMVEYLGETYLGLDTDCMYLSIIEKNYGLFLKHLKHPSVIKYLYTDDRMKELIEEFKELDKLAEQRLVEHNLFSRYFIGGQYSLLECSLDDSLRSIYKYVDRIKELDSIFIIFDYLHRFEKLGLKQLCDGILKSEYSKGMSDIYIYSTYLNYQNDLINKYPILLENSSIPVWLENFNYYERNYCQINIRQLERNKIHLDRRIINHTNNIKFNEYNKIVDFLLPYKSVFLADVDILNGDLDISKFDLVLVDDAHLSSSFKYHKVFDGKQVVLFGDSSTTIASTTNLFKQIPSKYIFKLVKGYIKDNSKYGNIANTQNQYILDFTKAEYFNVYNNMDAMVQSIVSKYYQDVSKNIDIVLYSNNYKFAFFKALVKKLKELYSDNDILEILNTNIRIVVAPKEKARICDEVYFLFDDFKDTEARLIKFIISNYSTGCQKVHIFSTKEYSGKSGALQQFKEAVQFDVDDGREMPNLTKVIYDELKSRGIDVERGIGRIDLVIKGKIDKYKNITPNVGIIIEGMDTKTPYSLIEDYQYYYNIYSENNWKIYIFYVDDIINHLQEKLDIISQFLSNQNTTSMHQLKIDEFIKQE